MRGELGQEGSLNGVGAVGEAVIIWSAENGGLELCFPIRLERA